MKAVKNKPGLNQDNKAKAKKVTPQVSTYTPLGFRHHGQIAKLHYLFEVIEQEVSIRQYAE